MALFPSVRWGTGSFSEVMVALRLSFVSLGFVASRAKQSSHLSPVESRVSAANLEELPQDLRESRRAEHDCGGV